MKYIMLVIMIIISVYGCETLQIPVEKLNIPEKTIILTFDDGPNEHSQVTAGVLDVLKSRNVRAFFSLVGFRVSNQQALTKRIYDEGHIITCHTWHHDPSIIGGADTVESEIDLFDKEVALAINVPGWKSLFFRTPLSILTDNIKSVVSNRNLRYLPFSCFQNDSESGPDGSRTVIDNIKRDLLDKDGGILVIHDGVPRFHQLGDWEYDESWNAANRSWVPAAVLEIIDYFTALGFRFNLTETEMADIVTNGFIL